MEGDLSNPDGITITPVQIWLNDIGTSAHTQFSNAEDPDAVLEMYEKYPELMECRMGLIHSHNTMSVFFSGEDVDELHDNSPGADLYFSLIVNNRGDYTGRIATIRLDEVEAKVITKRQFQRTGESAGVVRSNKKVEKEVLYMIQLEAVPPQLDVDSIILERYGYVQNKYKRDQEAREKKAEEAREQRVREFQTVPGKFRDTKRLPAHISDRQLGFNGKMVGEDSAYTYEIKGIVAKMLVHDAAFEGSLNTAIKKVCAQVDDSAAKDYAEGVLESMEEIYIGVSGEEFIPLSVENFILSFIATEIPDNCLALTKLKQLVREDLVDEMLEEEEEGNINDLRGL